MVRLRPRARQGARAVRRASPISNSSKRKKMVGYAHLAINIHRTQVQKRMGVEIGNCLLVVYFFSLAKINLD